MPRAKTIITERRQHTDASLGAERANTDSARRLKAALQLEQHDLLEHDRAVADERLWRCRSRADSLLAREPIVAPELKTAVANERRVGDEDKRVEREALDAHREEMRLHSISTPENEKLEHEGESAVLEGHRHDTDDQLIAERARVDVALDATMKALGDAQSAQERQRDLLGMVAHDLRNPLFIIAMNAETIAESTAEALTREDALEVRRAASRMDRLLLDLLDVGRIESQTLRIIRAHVDIVPFVTEILRSYQPLFVARKSTFDVEGPIPAIAGSFDHDRIVQVFSNLLGNALKFTPAGGAVRLRVEQQPGSDVEFILRDTGVGIHPDALPNVFKRFWQADTDARRGLGLGLYICEKIIEAHEGRIWVESVLGKGATFHFTLPAVAANKLPALAANKTM
jgi:signal transduction histidine kinase